MRQKPLLSTTIPGGGGGAGAAAVPAGAGGGAGAGVPSDSTKERPSTVRSPNRSRMPVVPTARLICSGGKPSSSSGALNVATAATDSNSVPCSRRSAKSPGGIGKSFTFRAIMSLSTRTRRPASVYGRGLSSTAFTTLKIAVVAPMPRPIVRMAVKVKPGALRRVRSA